MIAVIMIAVIIRVINQIGARPEMRDRSEATKAGNAEFLTALSIETNKIMMGVTELPTTIISITARNSFVKHTMSFVHNMGNFLGKFFGEIFCVCRSSP